jgi:2-hydroxychromene-2-carboxylate isomerase
MEIFPRLDRVTERVQDLVKMLDAQQVEKAEKVLGAELFALVVAGRAVPTRDVLIELAAALGVKPTWLLSLGE